MIKPQDVVLLLKLSLLNKPCSQAQLSRDLFISPSEVNAGIKRLAKSCLIAKSHSRWCVDKKAFHEFLVYALQYVFPAQRGEPVKGMLITVPFDVTGIVDEGAALKAVWPQPEGQDFGYSLLPLYPSVPRAAQKDDVLYQWLAILDTVRDWQNEHKTDALSWVKAKISGKKMPETKLSRRRRSEQQLTLL